ncbi:MAG: multidrug ABC transporter substrate-binding protein, partial [Bdellovibrionales bacterium]|nr:multidrug ABC transporter substrate-binding protein [Bdellovibrionales bacterium]
IRPFIIGEKVIEVSLGSSNKPLIQAGAEIPYEESFDIMEILSGRRIGSLVGSLQSLTTNLKVLIEAFADPQRTQALVRMFDRLDPLIVNLNQMSKGVHHLTRTLQKGDRLDSVIGSLVSITHELDKILPLMNAEAPDLGMQLGQVVENLNILTVEFKKLTPAIAAVAPRLPETSLRAVEALDETVVLLKALQKSFLLRGNVEDVREEESLRKPASK